MSLQTDILPADDHGIARATALLAAGAQVAFPTETVYGLGADARNGKAVAGIFAAKDRPAFNPLIVHLSDVSQAPDYVIWSENAARLAQAFWPGPMTLVLPLKQDHGLSPLVTAGLDTVGLRVPAHPLAHALLKAFNGPLAAPSANPSGRISPTCLAHVMAGLSDRIAAVLDGGTCDVGLESTIIGLSGPAPVLLRTGGIPQEAVEAVLNQSLTLPVGDTITAPGQMTSHYAPRAAVRLNADAPATGEAFLGFGPMTCDLNLSTSGDLHEAAATLFAHLHALDATGRPIAVAPIPDHGLGAAINDRLRRAAAPR
jgi:L-threonylcarbamoyladenylate synthase